MNNWLRHRFNNLIAASLDRSGALYQMEKTDRDKSGWLRVLAYHRIAELDGQCDLLQPDLINATPSEFARQMRYVTEHYHVLSAHELIELLISDQQIPPSSVLITFDDGYHDFIDCAWPILRELNLPVTVFIPTAYPGNPDRLFWWDRLHQGLCYTSIGEIELSGVGTLPLTNRSERAIAFEKIKQHLRQIDHEQAVMCVNRLMDKLQVNVRFDHALMNWNEIRGLAEEGVTFAAHSRTHPFLSQLKPMYFDKEIGGALIDLQREVGERVPLFCLPDGQVDSYDRLTLEALRRQGIIAAFTMVRGLNLMSKANPLALRRIGVDVDMSLPLFRACLTSNYARRQSPRQPIEMKMNREVLGNLAA